MVNISMSKYKKMNRKKAIWAMNAKLENHYTIEDIFFEIRRQEAREEGRKEGTVEFIKQLLLSKYNTDASAWLSSLSSDQLEQAPALILTCDTFDEFQNQINHRKP